MKPVNFLVIGGSAGSLHVILDLFAILGTRFMVPVLIVLHRNNTAGSGLEELLSSRTSRSVKEVEEKEAIRSGVIYTCPADYHVLIEKDHSFSLDYSERVNFSRPSIDVSFRSAADIYGKDLACLLLSGGNNDGVDGLKYAQEAGGVILIQDPATADVPFMPQQALLKVSPDLTGNAQAIASYILREEYPQI